MPGRNTPHMTTDTFILKINRSCSFLSDSSILMSVYFNEQLNIVTLNVNVYRICSVLNELFTIICRQLYFLIV